MARKKAAPVLTPEWSFQVEADKVGSRPLKISIKAGPEARKLLAPRLNVSSVQSVEADLTLQRQTGAVVHVSGKFDAHVKQACVITGKPLEDHIVEEFEAWFADTNKTVSIAKARHNKDLQKGNGEMPVLDESEDPEPFVEGKIDAGELVTQFLSLAINPYPHAEGVAYEKGDDIEKSEKSRLDNPFAALKEWKNNKQKD